jgi:hypothetical protein
LRGVSINAPDPIIEEALRTLQEEFGKGASKKEERLAALYLTEVEQVTARLNARQLPRTTRLLLAQRGVYVNLLTSVIAKMVNQSDGHTHASDVPASAMVANPVPRRGAKAGQVVIDPKLATE